MRLCRGFLALPWHPVKTVSLVSLCSSSHPPQRTTIVTSRARQKYLQLKSRVNVNGRLAEKMRRHVRRVEHSNQAPGTFANNKGEETDETRFCLTRRDTLHACYTHIHISKCMMGAYICFVECWRVRIRDQRVFVIVLCSALSRARKHWHIL